MTDGQYELIRQIVSQNQQTLAELRQEVKELHKIGNVKEIVITRLEARLNALESWQATLIQHLESSKTEKKTWLKDLALATFGAVLAYAVSLYTK